MGNVLRIVVGLAGLVAAGWSAGKVFRMRRSGQEQSFAQPLAILGATAVAITLTLLV